MSSPAPRLEEAPAAARATVEETTATAAPKGDEVRTVKGYSLPGEGSSTLISALSIGSIFALWWIATHMGWIRDLFLPTPEKVFTSFVDAWNGDIQGGRPLIEH